MPAKRSSASTAQLDFTLLRKSVKSAFSGAERPRVLIVVLSGIGNLLMASPLFRLLTAHWPNACIDVLVAPRGTPDVLAANPRIRHVLLGHPKPSFKQWVSMAYHLQRGRYGVGIVAHPGQLVTSASVLFFGNVRRRIGHLYSWGPWKQSLHFLTDGLPLINHERLGLVDRSAHDVIQNLSLLEPLGITAHADELQYDFPLAAQDHVHSDQWLRDHARDERMLIGFHPGAHGDLAYKRWPVERWIELGNRLADDFRATILVFGGPADGTIPSDIAQRLRGRAHAIALPLRATAALISRCAFFVSNDSGLMHVAVSQQVPTFGLFGPTDERRTAPWGPYGRVIRAPGTAPTYEVRSLREAAREQHAHPTLFALTVDHVLNSIRQAN